MIRDLLEASQELNRANDTYRLAHISAKVAKVFKVYAHVTSLMVDELENLDHSKDVITLRPDSTLKHPHCAPQAGVYDYYFGIKEPANGH